MKSNTYNTEIAATSSKILCASCDCQVGSENGERILCVHEMVRLYLLMLLLFDCLAESLLLELAARVSGALDTAEEESDKDWMWDMSNWTEEETESIKSNLLVLMDAAG